MKNNNDVLLFGNMVLKVFRHVNDEEIRLLEYKMDCYIVMGNAWMEKGCFRQAINYYNEVVNSMYIVIGWYSTEINHIQYRAELEDYDSY